MTKPGSDRLFESGIGAAHRAVFQSSLDILSSGGTLRRNMYALSHPGAEVSEIIRPCPDPLANIQYSCVYMLEHFFKSLSNDIGTNHSHQTYDANDVEKIYDFLTAFYSIGWRHCA